MLDAITVLQYYSGCPDSSYGQSLLDSVISGRGIAFLPRWGVARDLKQKRLMEIDLGDGPLSSSGDVRFGMYLLYHPPKFRLQKIRVTVDFLIAELGGDPQ